MSIAGGDLNESNLREYTKLAHGHDSRIDRKVGGMPKHSIEAAPEAAPRILEIRGQRVLLDSDLAVLYGVTTKRLNEQVRRNADRFPADFLLELSIQEVAASRSQFATLNKGRGHNVKYRPMAFTEHGAIMAATILNSPRAAMKYSSLYRQSPDAMNGAQYKACELPCLLRVSASAVR